MDENNKTSQLQRKEEVNHKMCYSQSSRIFSGVSCMWAVALLFSCTGGVMAYSDVTKLFQDKLGPNSGYMTTVRPLLDQSKHINVKISFDIMAIVEIDAIAQKFVVNGFVGLTWTDEIVAWNPADYNNTYLIHPEPKQIWRPRLVLTNTIEARDLFEDDYCPISVNYTGESSIYPGSLFPTSCKLNLYKYPFDEQDCYIEMYSMGLYHYELQFFYADSKVGKTYYTASGEWDVLEAELVVNNGPVGLPHFRVKFKLKRLPGFFIVNIVIPIVLMSFLNILVFLIPVDSGEKISYGITVLLALTVFMSIVSEQLPRTSDTLPLVTIYLLVLTVLSVCTVIVSVLIVYLHHREEEGAKHQKAASNFKSLFKKVNILNQAKKSFAHVKVKVNPATPEHQLPNSLSNFNDNDSTNNNTENSSISNQKQSFADKNVLNVINSMKLRGFNRNNCPEQQQHQQEQDPEIETGWERRQCGYVNRWKQFGQHLDCVSFLVFTLMWISVTIGFLVEISS